MRHNFNFFFDGGDDFGFSDNDGMKIGWIILILGVIFLIALVSG